MGGRIFGTLLLEKSMPFYVNVYTEMKLILFSIETPPDIRNGVQNLLFFFWPHCVAYRIFVSQQD